MSAVRSLMMALLVNIIAWVAIIYAAIKAFR